MLPEAHLTSHSRISGSRWVITPSWLCWSWRSFLYSSSVYSCHLFLISSASVRSHHFCHLLSPSFHEMFPSFVSLIFLKRYIVLPILLVSSISLNWSLRKTFLSLHVILWNFAFKWIYFLFTGICKDSSDSHFALLHFFFLRMVLISVSYTMSQTSIHTSSGTLSIGSSPLNLFLTSTV